SLLISDATLGTATASDNSGSVSIERTGVPAGNLFPVGTTTITYTATDGAGNTSSATQEVTVADNTVPSMTAPANINASTGPNATSCGVVITDLGAATATDSCGNATVSISGVPAGNLFPVG